MRFRKETIEWKYDSINLSRKEQAVVSRLRTGYTRATHRHVIEKRHHQNAPSVGCRSEPKSLWECTETTRERRETVTTKKGWNRRSEKTDRTYEENRNIPGNMNKDYMLKIKN
jgi:hypothetical protein